MTYFYYFKKMDNIGYKNLLFEFSSTKLFKLNISSFVIYSHFIHMSFKLFNSYFFNLLLDLHDSQYYGFNPSGKSKISHSN